MSRTPSASRIARFANRPSIFGLLLLGLPAALLLPGIAGFAYPGPEARFSDLAITHYPYALALQRAVAAGRIPLWSPSILSGAPFAANPLTGLWYPPGWLALLLPLPLGLNGIALLHIAWGGWGLYRLLRAEGLAAAAALFGGAAFALLPKLYAHYGAGHLTLLYAVPWTPWLLLAARKPGGVFSAWEAAILALIFTADPRWSVYAGATWLAYRLAHARRGMRLRSAGAVAGQALLAGMLAAPLALPLLEYTRLSTRAQMTASDRLAFSLPPERLLGLLYPDFGGFHEYTLYAGQALLALALLAWLGVAAGRGARFWRWTALLALVWSLGAALPFATELFSLPGLDLLRAPSRALFLAGLGLCALAAHAMDGLLSPEVLAEQLAPRLRRARLVLAALAGFSAILAGGAALAGGELPVQFVWGAAFLALAVAWIGLRLSARLTPRLFLAGIALLAAVDLFAMDRSLFVQRPSSAVLAEGSEAAKYLSMHFAAPPPRVYSPSYSLPQQTAALWGMHLADGVDPLQLQDYSEYMEKATGVPGNGYSVTLPAFATGDPRVDNIGRIPDAAALGVLNVSWIVSAFPLDAPGLQLEKQFGDAYLYFNQLARRERVQAALDDDAGQPGAAELREYSPERQELRAAGPGFLVVPELVYPGWQVEVDGRPAELLAARGLLRAVELPPGEHRVVFTFRPQSVYAGLALFVAACLFLLATRLRFKSARPSPTLEPRTPNV